MSFGSAGTGAPIGTQLFDEAFVQAGHRPQGACDQVQLVLDDQLRRRVVTLSRYTQSEQGPCAGLPGELRELVHRPDDEGGAVLVDVVVDDINRKRGLGCGERTVRVRALKEDPATVLPNWRWGSASGSAFGADSGPAHRSTW